jgi:integrase/recombinase XerD
MTKALVRKKPVQLDEWDNYVPLWLHGRPESTQEIYKPVIEDFMKFVDRRPISQIKLKDLQDYADRFTDQKARTVKRKLATVKSLLAFCSKTGMVPFNVGAALRVPKIPDDLAEKILPIEDIQRMITKEPRERNQVLLRVLYGVGIRAAEASSLNWPDVQAREIGGQLVVTGKGSKVRVIRLSTGIWNALQSIRPTNPGRETPVFITDQEKRMSRTYVSTIVRRAAKRAGIEAKVSAHWLRHGHATHSLDKGAPLPLIQKTLGHADLTTTGRYLHVRPDESSSRYLDG